MPLFGKKTAPAPPAPQPKIPPDISEADLADASDLIDLWDASLGDSDAVWGCLEVMARRGGYRDAQATYQLVHIGVPSDEAVGLPWRWWAEAGRVAHAHGNYVLAGRIFIFMYLFENQILPNMRTVDQMETGMARPSADSHRDIVRNAIESLEQLPPYELIHNTRTGQVDVAGALNLARSLAGN